MTPSVVHAMLNVDAGVPWPSRILDLSYGGGHIKLVPPKRKSPSELYDTYPIAVGQGRDLSEATANVPLVRRFLNALAWREQTHIREVGLEVTSWATHQAIQVLVNPVVDNFDSSSLVEPHSEAARLALAFYREGLSLQHTAFQFLSFFKVFNILNATGGPQIDWLNAHHAAVVGAKARKRVDALLANGGDVGGYLYKSGRCAVAHAFATPLVDPDSVDDERRLASDLPVIRELAAHYMQSELGLPAPRRAV